MLRTSRKPGERRDAQEIITRMLASNAIATIVIFGVVSIGAFFAGYERWSLSIAYSAGVLLALEALTALFSLLRFPRLNSGIVMVFGYVVKIIVIAVMMAAVSSVPILDLRVVGLGFMCGIIINLVTTTWVIIKEDGPNIDVDV
ncbi:hypothetical protein [Arcanobacterium pinnipediorum]|uniref:ATP synthase protein I n=1 Tax=Arcanobacterium pinnipediorum TaxID=1503041 RepID=A0ABY5AHP4_9ACTO|nr:hypothetical protein [Arcanobacterium pinnipediorum]USR79714.1 hypothetical protein NG665_01615 [Arcanobacterium pinnipediorum]